MDWAAIIAMLLPIILPLLQRLLDALLRQNKASGKPLSAGTQKSLARLRDLLGKLDAALDDAGTPFAAPPKAKAGRK